MKHGILYFFCGKMGAGKSTEAKSVAVESNAVLISEDEWLAVLYPEQIHTFDDYLQYSARIKPLVHAHVANILRAGASVVMDFPANTISQRKWFRELAEFAGATSKLKYLKVSDELCLTQIAKRRVEQPQRAAFDTESVFNAVSKYFQEPDESEGIKFEVVQRDG